jgi:hypothetical protein
MRLWRAASLASERRQNASIREGAWSKRRSSLEIRDAVPRECRRHLTSRGKTKLCGT